METEPGEEPLPAWLYAEPKKARLRDDWSVTTTYICWDCDMEWYGTQDASAHFWVDAAGVGWYRGHCPACGKQMDVFWDPAEMPREDLTYD